MNTTSLIVPLRFAHLAPDVWKVLGVLPRTGWVRRSVQNPESVQEHTISLRQIASSLHIFSSLEKMNLIDMLEVHDWPEAIHGDEVIVTYNSEEKKSKRAIKFEKEHQALTSICDTLGSEGGVILQLWLRFENSNDPLASFARQLDKYQAVEKSLEYEKTQKIICFKEFFDYAEKDIYHPVLTDKLSDLLLNWNTLNSAS